jgi:hypothetical protein
MSQPDPLIQEKILTDVAIAAATVFEERHLQYASTAARKDVRLTLVQIVSSAVLIYRERVAQAAASN